MTNDDYVMVQGEERIRRIQEAAAYIREHLDETPEIAMILGSGLGVLGDEVEGAVKIDYKDIPHFPVSTVAGHAGRLVCGELAGRHVMVMQGRFHYYEGYHMSQVTFPIYVMKELGINNIVITNAAGGLNRHFQAGDLMVITDHINFTGSNPLIGPNPDRYGPRFPDMSRAYDPSLIQLTLEKAELNGIQLQKGVYAGISGPAYMTPSELIMLRELGGDAVGMSTVPEVIAANHCGMKVLAISNITDMAIGEELEPLTHEQVIKMAEQTRPRLLALIKSIIPGVR